MVTVNKELQNLTLDEILYVSEMFLRGWHDPRYIGRNFRIIGLNHRREEYGLPLLTKEWSNEYRVDYVKEHYSYDEIVGILYDYISTHKMDDMRWVGIELFDCRFGRDYAKLFQQLIGIEKWKDMSEDARVHKLVKTQKTLYGGVGVASKVAYDKMLLTKSKELSQRIADYKSGNNKDASIFDSRMEKIIFHKLINKFGDGDVFYQYGVCPKDERYPYPCDFYIKSLDLFIELHFHYSHGDYWYDESNSEDVARVEYLLKSQSEKVNKSVKIWQEIDIEKRECARKNQLNYLVFWDGHYEHDGFTNGFNKYKPNLGLFNEWFDTYDCDYLRFIESHPECTY